MIYSFFVSSIEGIIFSVIISVISLIAIFLSLFNITIIKSKNRNHHLGMTIVYFILTLTLLMDYLIDPLKFSPILLLIIFCLAFGLLELYKFISFEKN